VSIRPEPRELRASDYDRELVLGVLSEAAADGRITLAEHSERAERACAARTLGDLAALTSDLALPSAQPIRIDAWQPVSAFFGREHRAGRWVVPARLPVTAVCGDVVLDLRDAVLPSQPVTVLATAIAGQIRLIVPDGVAVHMAGRSVLGTRAVRGRPAASPAGAAVIEVRAVVIGGRVIAVTRRRPRLGRPRESWRRALTGR
jgi:hypothetical protein